MSNVSSQMVQMNYLSLDATNRTYHTLSYRLNWAETIITEVAALQCTYIGARSSTKHLVMRSLTS